MIPDTPQTLLRRISELADGDDRVEWARFVELYEPIIRLYIAGRGDTSESDADDIVQDIFARLVDVLRNGGYKREKGRFRDYLAAMTRRILIDRHRRAQCRAADRTVSIDDMELASDAPDAAALVDAALRTARHEAVVRRILANPMIEETTRAAYRSYAIDGEDASAVAERFGITLNNLRQIKHRLDRTIAAIEDEIG